MMAGWSVVTTHVAQVWAAGPYLRVLTLCVNESSLHTLHSEYRRETTSTEVGCIGGNVDHDT